MAFQSITPAMLGRGSIATSPSLTTLYTVPASTRTLVKDIDICNTTSSVLTVTVYLVPSGGSAGASNILIPTISLNGNTPFQWTGVQVLNTGDTIQATASASGVTMNISGGEAV